MPNEQVAVRRIVGLYTEYNSTSGVPEGACQDLQNCQVGRDGLVEKRYGFSRYGQKIDPVEIFEYQKKLMVRDVNGVLWHDTGNENFSQYSSTYNPPDSVHQMRVSDSNESLVLTTEDGIYSTDSIDKDPTFAGIPPGLDLRLTLVDPPAGVGSHFANSEVAYRICFGRFDESRRLKQGAPSWRETIRNPGTVAVWERAEEGVLTTVTITSEGIAHEFSENQKVSISESGDPNIPNGIYTVSIIDVDAFTITASGRPLIGSGSINYGLMKSAKVEFAIHEDCQEKDFYELYRTQNSAAETIPAGDSCFLVQRESIPVAAFVDQEAEASRVGGVVTVTSTAHGMADGTVINVTSAEADEDEYELGPHEITYEDVDTFKYNVADTGAGGPTDITYKQKSIILQDDLFDVFLGAPLYTNPGYEGIERANSRPPFALDVATFKGYTFYANFTTRHFCVINFKTVADIVDDTSDIRISIDESTSPYIYKFSDEDNVQERHFKLETANEIDGLNVQATMKNFCRIVNMDTRQTSFKAFYTSGILDSPGEVTIEKTRPDKDFFWVNSNVEGNFAPALASTDNSYRSEQDTVSNGVRRSKLNQPEACPELSITIVGSETLSIVRIIPLRDSLIFITDRGVFRLSGDVESRFVVRPLDLTVEGVAPNTWVGTNNAACGLSTLGVLRVTDSGVVLISRKIDDKFKDVQVNPSFKSLCTGIGYDSSHQYIIWMPSTASGEKADHGWVYDSMNREWAGPWTREINCGFVSKTSNRLYISLSDASGRLLSERKSDTSEDYTDETYDIILTQIDESEDIDGNKVNVVTVQYAATEEAGLDPPMEGWLFLKDEPLLNPSIISKVDAVSDNLFRLTLSDFYQGLSITGSARVLRSIDSVVRLSPEVADNVGILKRFSFIQLFIEVGSALKNRVGIRTDRVPSETVLIADSSQTELGNIIRFPVPTEYQRAAAFYLMYQHKVGRENFSLSQVTYTYRLAGDRTSSLPLRPSI